MHARKWVPACNLIYHKLPWLVLKVREKVPFWKILSEGKYKTCIYQILLVFFSIHFCLELHSSCISCHSSEFVHPLFWINSLIILWHPKTCPFLFIFGHVQFQRFFATWFRHRYSTSVDFTAFHRTRRWEKINVMNCNQVFHVYWFFYFDRIWWICSLSG